MCSRRDILYLISTFLLTTLICQNNAETSSSYKVIVIGMKVEKLLASPEYALYIATDHYVNLVGYLMHNTSHKPDIIVFPEGGLQGENEPYPIKIPSTEDAIVPCNLGERYNLALRLLSCIAQEKKVYLAVNLIESHFNISINRTMKFNTDIVFNRQGAIVARYRKSNFNEIGYDTPGKPDVSYFLSDFGVEFGLLTGNDLLFKEPMTSLIEKHKVRHFIHPTKWNNELPFFTGIQMQAGWAYSMHSVLLSAGYNDPERGYSGTGIYQSTQTAIEYSQPEGSKAFALIGEVPKDVNQWRIKPFDGPFATGKGPNIFEVTLDKVINQPSILLEDNIEKMEEKIKNKHLLENVKSMRSTVYRSYLRMKRDKIELYKTKLLEPVIDTTFSNPKVGLNGSVTINETICTGTNKNRNQFCCKFEVTMSTVYLLNTTNLKNIVSGDNFTNYYYRLAVYDGVKNFTNRDSSVAGNIQICGIIPCLNKKIDSCGIRTDNFNTEPPTVTAPATIKLSGQTYTQTGTTFETINIETVTTNDDIDSYPIVLHRSPTTEEFGSLPEKENFQFNINKVNNTDQLVIRLETISDISDLGSIGIFTRVYHVPSSSIKINLSFSLLLIPVVIIFSVISN